MDKFAPGYFLLLHAINDCPLPLSPVLYDESMRVFYCWDEGHSSFSQRKRGRQWRPQPHRFVTTRRG
ncbi:hypothetical protein LINPERHAP2_LOCUS15899 [Linum perenne]